MPDTTTTRAGDQVSVRDCAENCVLEVSALKGALQDGGRWVLRKHRTKAKSLPSMPGTQPAGLAGPGTWAGSWPEVPSGSRPSSLGSIAHGEAGRVQCVHSALRPSDGGGGRGGREGAGGERGRDARCTLGAGT